MNDFTAKPSSALVVAENKAHRPGGCVGVFFKLFDWNRRFGKKKYFPKKLLAPARVNQVVNKFNADEKLPMPKQRLIAYGKGGVFPAVEKNVKGGGCASSGKMHDAKSPGLVARLMGLESMPLAEESRIPDNSSHSWNLDTKAGRFPGGLESDKEVLNLEKGCTRHELQPQKIQKTGITERWPVSRFGADALQIRNVLSSRSRKRHPKLASPVKSPRAARSSSTLMDTAARILEPGLQARSRTKCSLTYSNAKMDEVIEEESIMIDLSPQSSYQGCDSHGFMAQSSCQNCGHFRESDGISQSKHSMQNAFYERVDEQKPRLGMYCEKERQVVLLRSRHQPGQREIVPPNVQNQMRNGGYKVPLRSRRVSSSRPLNQTKDFIALNRIVSQSSVRLPRKLGNLTEVRRHYSVPKSDGLSTQKNLVRRSAVMCKQVESTSSSRLTTDGQRSMKNRVVTGNKVSVNSSTFKSRSCAEGGNRVSQIKDINVVSFTFSSPLKSKSCSFSPTQVENNKEMDQSNICCPKLVDEDTHEEKSFQMKEDAIGALLELKLKELTHQAEYESRTGVIQQERTTASILQELISALTAERPISPDTNDNLPSSTAVMDSTSQGETRVNHSSMRFSGDRLSPVSVFDASFSNVSCVSSSRDDASGHMFQSDDMDILYDNPHLLRSDADLLDSASSTITKINNNYKIAPVTHLLDHISTVLQKANLSNKYNIVPVLLNSEMLFDHMGRPERFVDFLVGPFLDELQNLAAAAWRSTVILGFDVSKGEKQNILRSFLFDCLVECLDLRYARYCDCGFRELCKLPTQMTMEALVQVFDYEVRKWASLAMMSTDEVIDWEMSTSLGKWTDFDVEGFESAAEIGQVIFQGLIDEVVADFLFELFCTNECVL